MKKLLFTLIFLISSIIKPYGFDFTTNYSDINVQRTVDLTTNSLLNDKQKTVIKTAGLILLTYLSYKSYNLIKTKLDQIIEQETIKLIELQFKLNVQCDDKELQKKAWSINLRKRFIEQLEKVDSTDSRWSENFDKEFNKLKKSFDTFDKIRNTVYSTAKFLANDYEKDYDKPYEQLSYFDRFIINHLINNTLLKYKPYDQCTLSEISKKNEMHESSKRIKKVIKNDLGKVAVNVTLNLLSSAFYSFIV